MGVGEMEGCREGGGGWLGEKCQGGAEEKK